MTGDYFIDSQFQLNLTPMYCLNSIFITSLKSFLLIHMQVEFSSQENVTERKSISLVTFLSMNNLVICHIALRHSLRNPYANCCMAYFYDSVHAANYTFNVFSYLIIPKEKVDNLEFFSPNTSIPQTLWLLSAFNY